MFLGRLLLCSRNLIIIIAFLLVILVGGVVVPLASAIAITATFEAVLHNSSRTFSQTDENKRIASLRALHAVFTAASFFLLRGNTPCHNEAERKSQARNVGVVDGGRPSRTLCTPAGRRSAAAAAAATAAEQLRHRRRKQDWAALGSLPAPAAADANRR